MNIRMLQRCPSAKYSFVISIQAHELFATMTTLKAMLGEQIAPVESGNDDRPWYLIFVKDSTEGAGRWSKTDGLLDLRLYINCEEVAIQFKLMCEASK